MGSALQQEYDTAGHIVSSSRKYIEMNTDIKQAFYF